MYKKMPSIKIFFIAIFCAFLTTSVFAKVSEITMSNLNKAFRGETNASHRYELFAEKADAEGYKQIAKLFRAVSMAESIHRNNHKAVILTLGGKPDVVEYDAVKVRTTRENLQVPVKGETYEKNVMYPNFIKQAKIDGVPEAVRTFTFSDNAEKQHEKLFEDALNNFGRNKPADYCINRITGATYAVNLNSQCPSGKCGSVEEYIRVKDSE